MIGVLYQLTNFMNLHSNTEPSHAFFCSNFIYTYKTEIPSVRLCVCLSVCPFVIYLLAEVPPQVHIFGIGTKPNVLQTF